MAGPISLGGGWRWTDRAGPGGMEADRAAGPGEQAGHPLPQFGGRAPGQRHGATTAGVIEGDRALDQIETELEGLTGAVQGFGPEAAWVEVERGVPAMVAPRQQGHRRLADDLA